jgi:hypothetical protein
LDFDELQQLIGDILKGFPIGDPDLLPNLHDDLQRVSLGRHVREPYETRDPSAADVETLNSLESCVEKLIEILAEGGDGRQRVFRRLLPVAQSSEAIEDAFEHLMRGAQPLYDWANDYRRSHPATRRVPGRTSQEAQTWLVENELPRIFAERFGGLASCLTSRELAERRNLFIVRTTKLLRVPMGLAAIKKKRQRAKPS